MFLSVQQREMKAAQISQKSGFGEVIWKKSMWEALIVW